MRGTDIASGQAFEYQCPTSVQTVAPIPAEVPVVLDVSYSTCSVVTGVTLDGMRFEACDDIETVESM